jgi:hypothetical protein
MFRSSHFQHQVSSRPQTTGEVCSIGKGKLWAKYVGNFAGNCEIRAIVGTFYMPQICDMGKTALIPLRRKARWGLLPEKCDRFGWFRPGNSATIGQRGNIESSENIYKLYSTLKIILLKLCRKCTVLNWAAETGSLYEFNRRRIKGTKKEVKKETK